MSELFTASCTPPNPPPSQLLLPINPPTCRLSCLPLHEHFLWPTPPPPVMLVVQVMENLQDNESSWSQRCKEKLCPVSDSSVKIRAIRESGRTSAYQVALHPSPPEAKSHTAVLQAPCKAR